MNCYLHTDVPAVAFCRSCGKPLCAVCQRPAEGTVFCSEHMPGNPYASAPNGGPNPYVQTAAAPGIQTSAGLAFLLGLIPGVGAIYNAQYMKGLVHAVIFGLLISLINGAGGTGGEPFLAMLMVAFYCYMPFEAYHTARKRQSGLAVEEWSSLITTNSRFPAKAPIGPVLLIALGVLFLMDSLNVLHLRDVGRFWPVILIVIGAAMLYSRISPSGPVAVSPAPQPYPNPRNPDVVEPRHEQ